MMSDLCQLAKPLEVGVLESGSNHLGMGIGSILAVHSVGVCPPLTPSRLLPGKLDVD